MLGRFEAPHPAHVERGEPLWDAMRDFFLVLVPGVEAVIWFSKYGVGVSLLTSAAT